LELRRSLALQLSPCFLQAPSRLLVLLLQELAAGLLPRLSALQPHLQMLQASLSASRPPPGPARLRSQAGSTAARRRTRAPAGATSPRPAGTPGPKPAEQGHPDTEGHCPPSVPLPGLLDHEALLPTWIRDLISASQFSCHRFVRRTFNSAARTSPLAATRRR